MAMNEDKICEAIAGRRLLRFLYGKRPGRSYFSQDYRRTTCSWTERKQCLDIERVVSKWAEWLN